MFFDRLSEACSMHGTSPSAVAIQIGRSKSNVTGWKKGQIPSSDTVTAIADVLQVPTDFLLERPPFDCWELINQNRKGFLHYVDIMPETLKLIWGIDPENPEAAPTEHFIRFLQNVVSEVRATEDGDWVIALKEPYTHKKTPVLTKKDERDIAKDLENIKKRRMSFVFLYIKKVNSAIKKSYSTG